MRGLTHTQDPVNQLNPLEHDTNMLSQEPLSEGKWKQVQPNQQEQEKGKVPQDLWEKGKEARSKATADFLS